MPHVCGGKATWNFDILETVAERLEEAYKSLSWACRVVVEPEAKNARTGACALLCRCEFCRRKVQAAFSRATER